MPPLMIVPDPATVLMWHLAPLLLQKVELRGIVFTTGMYTEIGSIAAVLRFKSSKRRPVKRNPDGKAGPYCYTQAYAMTNFDALGRFLGVNVSTPAEETFLAYYPPL